LKEDNQAEDKVGELSQSKSKGENVTNEVENLLVHRLQKKLDKQKKKQQYDKKCKDSCGLQ
jgi:hypothetical protein